MGQGISATEKNRKKSHPLRTTAALFLIAAAGTLFFLDQNNRLDPEELKISSARLPAAFDGFRIVLLSDGHGKEFGKDNELLLRAVQTARPDLIVYTGDMIDEKKQIGGIAPLARGLSQIAPTYYVTGNHEWAVREMKTVFSLLEQNGVIPLRNTYVPIQRDGAKILLAGVDDPNGPADQKTPQALASELKAEQGDIFTILLAHRNSLFPSYAACGFDLVLSGHGHGGIVRLPFTDGLFGTERNLFPTYTNGLYTLENSQLVVSRGLGNVGRSFRVFNRPHLPVLILSAS